MRWPRPWLRYSGLTRKAYKIRANIPVGELGAVADQLDEKLGNDAALGQVGAPEDRAAGLGAFKGVCVDAAVMGELALPFQADEIGLLDRAHDNQRQPGFYFGGHSFSNKARMKASSWSGLGDLAIQPGIAQRAEHGAVTRARRDAHLAQSVPVGSGLDTLPAGDVIFQYAAEMASSAQIW